MKFRYSLSLKISLLAFLNVVLLVAVFLLFARFQFRLDLGSFVFAPARDRMIGASRLIALQLPNTPRESWNQVIAQYGSSYPAQISLFDNEAQRLAGSGDHIPDTLALGMQRLGAMHRHMAREMQSLRPPRPEGPPLMFATSSGIFWVAVPVPIWTAPQGEPIHGSVVWQFNSFWTNSFFFDYRPWLTVFAAVVVISIACWLPLIRRLTREIARMTSATQQIAGGHFEIELPARRRDELGQLSASINRMAGRLAEFVHGQRRFLSDIAHELCSPIARMQVALGILEQRSAEKEAAYVADVQEELTHMSGLINELLSFSKAQMSAGTQPLTRVNVAETVQRVLEREGTADAAIETQVPAHVDVLAQPEYLFRSISNLVRNAVRYAAAGGPIVVSASNTKGNVSITVADNGPGLPESELDKVFKPFYRPEFARQRETGGAGLGLAIVKSCVEACGGVVEARKRRPKGLEVEIRLQAAEA